MFLLKKYKCTTQIALFSSLFFLFNQWNHDHNFYDIENKHKSIQTILQNHTDSKRTCKKKNHSLIHETFSHICVWYYQFLQVLL